MGIIILIFGLGIGFYSGIVFGKARQTREIFDLFFAVVLFLASWYFNTAAIGILMQ